FRRVLFRSTLGANNKRREETGLKSLAVAGSASGAGDEQALAQGQAIAAGVAVARELGNLPPNVCNPAYVARQGREFAARVGGKVSCEVLDRDQMQALGMGSLLAVSQGSANPPQLVVMKYDGGGK